MDPRNDEETTDYTELKKDELLEVAEEKGVTVSSSSTKADIVEVLEESDKNPAYGVPTAPEGEEDIPDPEYGTPA